MPRRAAIALFLAGCLAAGSALALDFVSVAAPSAILYDAPSTKSRKMFVVSRYMPLEAVVDLQGWIKVRDSSGALAWIEKSALGNRRFVMVTAPLADVRSSPDAAAQLLFQVRQQVALEWLGDTGMGWIKVRQPDGAVGYISADEVWGD